MILFWFRRDLRLEDNVGLTAALEQNEPVQPIFIFDKNILDSLPKDDARVTFIFDSINRINEQLKQYGSSLLVKYGNPIEELEKLIEHHPISQVHTNADYEPYALERDKTVQDLMDSKNVLFETHLDHILFKPGTILKKDGTPYTVFTPFKKMLLSRYNEVDLTPRSLPNKPNFHQADHELLPLELMGFTRSNIPAPSYSLSGVNRYLETRDIPSVNGTSKLGVHLRFGTVGLREIIKQLNLQNEGDQTFLSELIWREFFINILWHFPRVVNNSFKVKYDRIQWRNDPDEFDRWCQGKTGYPIVDAGMRELNATGNMHNRVRMIVGSFLCKHLLIDWRWGEAYFAEKLFDFELASNNGNWQWVAGTGCDSAPYFRVFNPTEQTKKFDPDLKYIRKWVPKLDSLDYPLPMVDHKFARNRALETYKQALN